jgi:hypothetical protein
MAQTSSAYERGSSGARADEAAARAPGELAAEEDLRARQEQLLDEGLEETFPASDPVAVMRLT